MNNPKLPFFLSIIVFFAGALTVISFSPFHGYLAYLSKLIPFITLAVLILFWLRATPRFAACLGFAFGLGFFGFGVSWIYVSMHDFGFMPALLAAIATFLFCAFLACFPALVGYLQTRFFSKQYFFLSLPALWALSEWVRGWFLTGFPWLSLGYSQVEQSPLVGYAPIVGVYGVSMVVVLCATLLVSSFWFLVSGFKTIDGKEKWKVVISLFSLFIFFSVGFTLKKMDWTKPVGEPIKVSLLQGNIPQDMKFKEDRFFTTLETYKNLILASDSRLIVLPETALPRWLHQIPEHYLQELKLQAQKNNADILLGVPVVDKKGEKIDYYNSAISIGTNPSQRYDKSHLVPLGEFIPFGFNWILNILQIPLSDFSRGEFTQKPLQIAGQKVAVNICYEDVFGEEIIRPLPEATLLVNISNVAWFGDSLAPAQHLQISQMRAMETGRYMLRATNTGMTAIINEKGRVIKKLPRYQQARLDGNARGFQGSTPYVIWGNSSMLLIAGLLLAAALASSPKSKK